MQIAYQHANDSVPLAERQEPACPAELDELVLWATARDPEERPRDARVMLDQLRDTESAADDGAARPAPSRPRRRWCCPRATPDARAETQVLGGRAPLAAQDTGADQPERRRSSSAQGGDAAASAAGSRFVLVLAARARRRRRRLVVRRRPGCARHHPRVDRRTCSRMPRRAELEELGLDVATEVERRSTASTCPSASSPAPTPRSARASVAATDGDAAGLASARPRRAVPALAGMPHRRGDDGDRGGAACILDGRHRHAVRRPGREDIVARRARRRRRRRLRRQRRTYVEGQTVDARRLRRDPARRRGRARSTPPRRRSRRVGLHGRRVAAAQLQRRRSPRARSSASSPDAAPCAPDDTVILDRSPTGPQLVAGARRRRPDTWAEGASRCSRQPGFELDYDADRRRRVPSSSRSPSADAGRGAEHARRSSHAGRSTADAQPSAPATRRRDSHRPARSDLRPTRRLSASARRAPRPPGTRARATACG